MAEFIVGQKVTYIPFDGASSELHERGMIKEIRENIIFVVFHCNNLWGNFIDYTGQGCNPGNLKSGWL